jgi:hypothetical protein
VDWLTFIATFVGHVAWPLVLIIVVLLFREPLGDLIGNLRRLRYRGFDMHFGKRMERIERDANRLPPPTAEVEDSAVPLETVAEAHPPTAVLEAWQLVDHVLRIVGKRNGLDDSLMSSGQLIQALQEKGVLNVSFAGLLEDLWHFRNDVAHVDTIPTDQARRYVGVAKNVAARLRAVGR